MRKTHYLGLMSLLENTQPCRTCQTLTWFICLSCDMPACIGCKGRHSPAHFVNCLPGKIPTTTPHRFNHDDGKVLLWSVSAAVLASFGWQLIWYLFERP